MEDLRHVIQHDKNASDAPSSFGFLQILGAENLGRPPECPGSSSSGGKAEVCACSVEYSS